MPMPTNELQPQFFRDYARLSEEQREKYKAAVRAFVEDLRERRPVRASLRVKGVRDQAGVFEMTWDMPNGRATFRYGPTKVAGEQHIIWLRIGGHEIVSGS
jgi:hypothetical protein